MINRFKGSEGDGIYVEVEGTAIIFYPLQNRKATVCGNIGVFQTPNGKRLEIGESASKITSTCNSQGVKTYILGKGEEIAVDVDEEISALAEELEEILQYPFEEGLVEKARIVLEKGDGELSPIYENPGGDFIAFQRSAGGREVGYLSFFDR